MNLDYAVAPQEAAFEKDHWWVRSRFGLMDRLLGTLGAQAPWSILELGCGTGVNLDYLESHYGDRIATLCGVDPEAVPRRDPKRTIQRELPRDTRFDLVVAMDVLEHLENPAAVLVSLAPILKPAGRLLVTAPAHPWLWTRYDDLAHHRRRYTLKGLVQQLQEAGFVVEERFYLFATLFPLFMAQRLALKIMPWREARVFRAVPPWMNRLFFSLTAWEMKRWMSRNRWWGSSVVASARRIPPP